MTRASHTKTRFQNASPSTRYKTLFDENSPFSLGVTFLTSLSNFSSYKINKSLILISINVMVWKLLKDNGSNSDLSKPFQRGSSRFTKLLPFGNGGYS